MSISWLGKLMRIFDHISPILARCGSHCLSRVHPELLSFGGLGGFYSVSALVTGLFFASWEDLVDSGAVG